MNGQAGLDLRDQEGSSPRRMAPRHASVENTGHDITIRDLDSPGGTFVNQQRLLSGQARKLKAGDVIQLGGVQLKLKESVTLPALLSAPANRAAGTSAAAAAPQAPVAPPSQSSRAAFGAGRVPAAGRTQSPAAKAPPPAAAAPPARPSAASPAPAALQRPQPATGGAPLPASFVLASGAAVPDVGRFSGALGPELGGDFATSWFRGGCSNSCGGSGGRT